MYRKLLSTLICASLLTIAASPAQAQGKNDVNPKVLGKTIGEWSAAWWQWAFSIPADVNPITDETGDFCDVGQPDGRVWFLAGTFGGAASRVCTIPADRAIFYPLVNFFAVNCPSENSTEDEFRAFLAESIDQGCQLTSTLDGVPTALSSPTVRTQSPEFAITLPAGGFFENACGDPEFPVGEPVPGWFSDGSWIMLPPLSPGEHELHFHGALCDPDTGEPWFETEVTYHLTVVDDDDDD